jgi:23S rRNA pseudouridine2605 synthase
MRLQKFLAQAGVASRRQAEQLIKAGSVTVNGAVVDSLGYGVDVGRDQVEVDGQRVRQEAAAYRVLLKPRACLSTLADPKPGDHGGEAVRDTLARYVRDRAVGWTVVAPLDFPAEGVVLLTTDGELAERMSRGGGSVSMTYHIKFQGRVGDEEVGRLLLGWKWERRPIKPDSVTALATTGKNTWVEVVVKETRPRVIKLAGNPIRKSVLKISRVRLGPVSFEGLAMGESRDLTKAEVTSLRRAAGIGGESARGVAEPATAGKAAPAARPPGGGPSRQRSQERSAGPGPQERQQRPARPTPGPREQQERSARPAPGSQERPERSARPAPGRPHDRPARPASRDRNAGPRAEAQARAARRAGGAAGQTAARSAPESRIGQPVAVLKKRREQDGARAAIGVGKDGPRRPRTRS